MVRRFPSFARARGGHAGEDDAGREDWESRHRRDAHPITRTPGLSVVVRVVTWRCERSPRSAQTDDQLRLPHHDRDVVQPEPVARNGRGDWN